MAMTDNGDNDTSVQSKVERDKTVATKEGSLERTSGWWNSNDKANQPWFVVCPNQRDSESTNI